MNTVFGTQVDRQGGAHIDSIVGYCIENMNLDFRGKSIRITEPIDQNQQTLFKNGEQYSFFHQVPTEASKVQYARSTIKGIILHTQQHFFSKDGTLQATPKEITVLDESTTVQSQSTEWESNWASEAIFVRTKANFATMLSTHAKLFVKTKPGEFILTPATSLNSGDEIGLLTPRVNQSTNHFSLEKARYWMLLLGDGHVRKKKRNLFITSGDLEIRENFFKLTGSLFGRRATINGTNSSLNPVAIAKELLKLGFSSEDKPSTHKPIEILDGSQETMLSAPSGLIDSDGNVWKNQLRIDTAYYSLALDFATLFAKLGLVLTINCSKSTFGVRTKVTQEMAQKIAKFVVSVQKKQRLLRIQNKKRSREHELIRLDGKYLKMVRKSHGDTLESLAQKIGSKFKQVWEWEQNKRRIPKKMLERMADVYEEKRLKYLVEQPLIPSRIAQLEKIVFEQPKEFVLPKTTNAFITNFIVAKR